MAATTNGKNRLFGATTIRRITELRRQAVVTLAEATGPEPATDDDFPITIDVLRREVTDAGSPAAGIAPTWGNVAGLTDLVGRVRSNGRWRDEEVGNETLAEDFRLVTIMDVPETDNVGEDIITTTDRVRFNDPARGVTVWDVKKVRLRPRDGIAVVLAQYARED